MSNARKNEIYMGFPEHQSFVLEIMIDWLQLLKHFFINVSYHKFVDFLINKVYPVSNSDDSVLSICLNRAISVRLATSI